MAQSVFTNGEKGDFFSINWGLGHRRHDGHLGRWRSFRYVWFATWSVFYDWLGMICTQPYVLYNTYLCYVHRGALEPGRFVSSGLHRQIPLCQSSVVLVGPVSWRPGGSWFCSRSLQRYSTYAINSSFAHCQFDWTTQESNKHKSLRHIIMLLIN